MSEEPIENGNNENLEELKEIVTKADTLLANTNQIFEEIKTIVTEANTLISDANEQLLTIKSGSNAIDQKLTQATQNLTNITASDTNAEKKLVTIEKHATEIKAHAKATAKLSSKAVAIESKLDSYESSLKDYLTKYEDLHTSIEGLLPGATSAGLASAFKERKDSFRVPKIIWGTTFVISMFVLFFIAGIDPISWKFQAPDIKNLTSYFISRVPFLIPVIWLAIYANRRHTEALRLEEDYAHKEALSKSFEGYKEQVKNFETTTDSASAIKELFDQVLSAIALHPGRVYGTKDITPLHSFSDAFKKDVKKES